MGILMFSSFSSSELSCDQDLESLNLAYLPRLAEPPNLSGSARHAAHSLLESLDRARKCGL